MAINSLDAIDIIFGGVLPIMQNTKKPNGSVYKVQRPINSVKEDIVVTGLALNRDTGFQNGVLNVNIHVQNLSITSGGITDNSQPNISRIKELTAIIETLIGDIYGDYYSYEIDQDNLFIEEKSSYNNIRVTFRALNQPD